MSKALNDMVNNQDAAKAPPTYSNAYLADLMVRQIAAQEEMNRLLRAGLEPPSEWLSQDEAAVILGQTVKPSGNHLTHLRRYRDNGWLTIFSSCNPYRYSRKEVEALADDFHNDRKYPLAR